MKCFHSKSDKTIKLYLAPLLNFSSNWISFGNPVRVLQMLSSTTSSLNTQEELDKVRWRLFVYIYIYVASRDLVFMIFWN